MIVAKYQVIIARDMMMQAFDLLMKHRGLPTKVTKNIAKIAVNIDQNSNRIKREWQELIKEHGLADLKDDKVTPAQRAKLVEIHKDFGEKTFKIDRQKILLSDIESVGLSAGELLAIEDFVEGMEDEPKQQREKPKDSKVTKLKPKEVRA